MHLFITILPLTGLSQTRWQDGEKENRQPDTGYDRK